MPLKPQSKPSLIDQIENMSEVQKYKLSIQRHVNINTKFNHFDASRQVFSKFQTWREAHYKMYQSYIQSFPPVYSPKTGKNMIIPNRIKDSFHKKDEQEIDIK